MYLFVYKTTHVNGKFYIGRHSTNDLNDGYLGSGRWVSGIKNKSTLSREILAEAISFDELKKLEEYYIDLHWDNPLCMNMIKGSDGWTSEDQFRKVADGTHNLLKRPDGSSVTSDRVKEGTHPWQTRPDGSSVTTDRVKEGTHQWQTRPDGSSLASDRVKDRTHNLLKREDGSSLASDRVKEGTHHLLKREDGSSLASDRVKEGTHPLLKRPDGTSVSSDRVANGTNPFQTRPDGSSLTSDRVKDGTHNLVDRVTCYDKSGKCVQIPKEQYHSQFGPKEDWEWVHNLSKEGRRRKFSATS